MTNLNLLLSVKKFNVFNRLIKQVFVANLNDYRESSGYDGLDLRCFEVTNAPHKNVKNDVE